jgi:hypothetical protein
LNAVRTQAERIAQVSSAVIHGWHSNLILKYRGTLYVCGIVADPGLADAFKHHGVFFRREPDGAWSEVGVVPHAVYSMSVGPDGRFWAVAPNSFQEAQVYRMTRPLDFGSFTEVYNGTCSYEGAGVSPEGNFLMLYAESTQMAAFTPNAVRSAFYARETGEWHESRMVTPEGRYGYEGIILRGRTAIAVLNSSIRDPEATPTPPHYSWRHLRLAGCDDLATGAWRQRPFVMPRFGYTGLQDLMLGPDGNAYLLYLNQTGETLEEAQSAPMTQYLARIHPDLSAEVFTTGMKPSPAKLFCDRRGRWFLVAELEPYYHLWQLDPDAGFSPVKEWELPGTEVLEGYICHTLRPERFGGEVDGDTIHLMTARYLPGTELAELWHVCFELPRD